jgi:DNA mismatch endonuclease (patch repair protein)
MKKATASARSRNMAAVKSRGNRSTEKKFLKILHDQKLTGWRRHYGIKGTPDFCWPKKKIAIFIDGCFWHGCPRCYKCPKSNVKFWKTKIDVNRERDRRVNRVLRSKGWVVIRIWECRVNDQRQILRLNVILPNPLVKPPNLKYPELRK